jgi:hypothetical protein
VAAQGLEALRAVKGFGDQPYWAAAVPGSRAVVVWRNLRKSVEETGYWPVIVGPQLDPASDSDLDWLAGDVPAIRAMSDAQLNFRNLRRTPAETLEAAKEVPFEQWAEQQRDPEFHVQDNLRKARYFEGVENAEVMVKHYRQAAERYRELPKEQFDPTDYPFPPRTNHNPPQHEPRCVKRFNVSTLKWEVAEAIAILLVPTRHGWEVPAYTFYSTAEGERPPQVHVVALKWLFDQFGAELLGLDSRMLEVVPQTRPKDRVTALRAAFYLAAYSHCPATSESEMASTGELARYLMESEYWTFCWP